MNRLDVVDMIVAARIAKGLSWAEVAEHVGIAMSGKYLPYKQY